MALKDKREQIKGLLPPGSKTDGLAGRLCGNYHRGVKRVVLTLNADIITPLLSDIFDFQERLCQHWTGSVRRPSLIIIMKYRFGC